ncbi:glycosyltransferase [Mycobacterium celatum]|uniref:Glycosyltransferase n=1 Tax=Mycobacterium celatum TaxID=28045 RepID=A0A1X1RVS0_MYCCE|nr:glycosyltransferase [Mycobacterium celatum]ORV18578.1 glycosyltransferase [Mycobacterium celatum]PIB81031.1 glycosyltransferase [Mycobacterium celatum]
MKFVLAGYGSRGDVEPCLAVGRELLRRGHDVQMAAPPDMLGFVKSVGLAAVAYGQDTQEQSNTATDFVRRMRNPIIALAEVAERVTQAWLEKSTALTSLADGADLLVAGMNEQALATNVAEYHGIPLAALHFFPARIWSSDSMYAPIVKAADEAQRRALGLPETTVRQTTVSLEIQAYDELCLPGPAAEWLKCDGRRPFVGALTLGLPTDEDDEVLFWVAAGTPPIYFGFGSTPIVSLADLVDMIGAACMQLGERALVCAGANEFGSISHPEHVKIVRSVNHAAVLPTCRAVVHHGGAGTTAAGMRAGIPTLILWHWLDQPVWAAGVEQLKVGSGRQFSATTRESLVADLHTVLSPQYAGRAADVAAQMSTPAQSVTRAADLLEDAARQR